MSFTTLLKTNCGISQVSLETRFFDKRCININGDITDILALDFTDKILELNLPTGKPLIFEINERKCCEK